MLVNTAVWRFLHFRGKGRTIQEEGVFMRRRLCRMTLFLLVASLLVSMIGCEDNSSSTSTPTPQPLVSNQITSDKSDLTSSNSPGSSTASAPTGASTSTNKTATTQSNNAATTSSVTSAPTTQTNNQGQTVYVGASGTKYHNENCRTLKNTKIPMSISDAKAKGYTACGVCKPPQ